MNDEVIIGVSFSEDVDQFDETGNLVFSGAALEAGVWTDAHGNTAYFPADIISKSADLFVGVDILCEHQGIPIGKVIATEPTKNGFKVTKGIITSKRMIAHVMEKNLKGLSIQANVRIDPVRKVVLEIFGAKEISLVKNPACKVCMLDNYQLDNNNEESGVAMAEAETKKENKIYPEPNCEQFKNDPKVYEACKTFAKAVETFRKAQEEWHSMFASEDMEKTEMSAIEEEVVEETTEEITEDETELSAETVEQEENEEVAETEIEASAEEEAVVEEETVVEEENVEETVSETVDEVAELKSQLEDAEIQMAAYRAEISVLTARVDAFETDARSKLVTEVLSADPNADRELIDGMSTPALVKYLETVMRLSKPTVGATKKSVKKEEGTVALSGEVKKETKKDDAVDALEIIQLLKTRQ